MGKWAEPAVWRQMGRGTITWERCAPALRCVRCRRAKGGARRERRWTSRWPPIRRARCRVTRAPCCARWPRGSLVSCSPRPWWRCSRTRCSRGCRCKGPRSASSCAASAPSAPWARARRSWWRWGAAASSSWSPSPSRRWSAAARASPSRSRDPGPSAPSPGRWGRSASRCRRSSGRCSCNWPWSSSTAGRARCWSPPRATASIVTSSCRRSRSARAPSPTCSARPPSRSRRRATPNMSGWRGRRAWARAPSWSAICCPAPPARCWPARAWRRGAPSRAWRSSSTSSRGTAPASASSTR